MARRARGAAAAALAGIAFAAAPPAAAGGGACAAQTLDCGNAPAPLCAAFMEALSAGGARRGVRLADTPGRGPHMRVEISHVGEIGMGGRLVRQAPGGAEKATPIIEIVVMDHPGGLPDSAYRDFAEALLRAETEPMR